MDRDRAAGAGVAAAAGSLLLLEPPRVRRPAEVAARLVEFQRSRRRRPTSPPAHPDQEMLAAAPATPSAAAFPLGLTGRSLTRRLPRSPTAQPPAPSLRYWQRVRVRAAVEAGQRSGLAPVHSPAPAGKHA